MKEVDRASVVSALRTSGLGIDAFDVEREVLRALPERFVLAYELLWLRVYGVAGGASGMAVDPDAAAVGTRRVVRTSTGQTETRGGAHAGHRAPGVGTKATVRDDVAFRAKQKVDRKLRALAREMAGAVSGGEERAGVRRCTRPTCRKWAEDTWTHCPWDGAPTEEVN